MYDWWIVATPWSKRLFCGGYNGDAPRAIADFDPIQFLARFEIDDGDVV